MPKVKCEIEYVDLKNDSGRTVEGVQATCSECEHTTQSFGTSPASVRRCLAVMAEECPEAVGGERNFYVNADE